MIDECEPFDRFRVHSGPRFIWGLVAFGAFSVECEFLLGHCVVFSAFRFGELRRECGEGDIGQAFDRAALITDEVGVDVIVVGPTGGEEFVKPGSIVAVESSRESFFDEGIECSINGDDVGSAGQLFCDVCDAERPGRPGEGFDDSGADGSSTQTGGTEDDDCVRHRGILSTCECKPKQQSVTQRIGVVATRSHRHLYSALNVS